MTTIYIAGPECFQANAAPLLGWMRLKSETEGFAVSLPNDDELVFSDTDLRSNADTIYANCHQAMAASDVIICDLEAFRGAEPDGGSVFELGMAFARGMRLYGYTRDARPLKAKDPEARISDAGVVRPDGSAYPYAELAFAPSIVGSSTLVEGDFAVALDRLLQDAQVSDRLAAWGLSDRVPALDWERPQGRPRVWVSQVGRYAPDAPQREGLSAEAKRLGVDLVWPRTPEPADLETVAGASVLLRDWVADLLTCSGVLADLADFRGWEPSADVSFECGLATQLGMPVVGHMPDTRHMVDRIPHLGAERDYRDLAGANVENFDYPINLMFASSMPVVEGDAAAGLRAIAERVLVDG